MPRIFFAIIFLFIINSCKIENENKCKSKNSIIEWYLSDINKIVEFYLDKNTDKEFPVNSYYHLEILSSNTQNIDSLDILLLEYGTPHNNKLEYINKWVNWLKTHKCYSLSKANEIFESINDKYGFNKLEISDEQLNKARKKYPKGIYSEEELDSIIRLNFIKRNKRSRLGWYNFR